MIDQEGLEYWMLMVLKVAENTILYTMQLFCCEFFLRLLFGMYCSSGCIQGYSTVMWMPAKAMPRGLGATALSKEKFDVNWSCIRHAEQNTLQVLSHICC